MWNQLRHWPMCVKLRMVRALNNCSQAEMAKYLACSPRTYQRWEREACPIPYRTWQWVNERLKMSVDAHERVELERRASFYKERGEERYEDASWAEASTMVNALVGRD